MMAVAISQKRGRSLDWFCAFTALAVGVVLLLPGNSLAWRISYAPLLERAPETTWAIVLIALAAGRMCALIVNGRAPQGSPALRAFVAMLSALIWSQFLKGEIDLTITAGVASTGLAFTAALLGAELRTIGRATADFTMARRRRNGSR